MLWKAEYATGIHNIDHQHKEIVAIITRFEVISKDKARWDEVHPLILHTKEFMKFHFAAEESLMRLLPYPDFDAHRAGHQQDLETIAEVQRSVLHGTDHGRLALRMRRFLFGHIVLSDRPMAQHALSLFVPTSSWKGKDGTESVPMR